MNKKNLSIANLQIAQTMGKVLTVLICLGVVEMSLYIINAGNKIQPLIEVYEHCFLLWLFLIALVIIIVILKESMGTTENMVYTLKRLSISNKETFLVTWAVNAITVLVLFAWQAILILLIGMINGNTGPEIAMTVYGMKFINSIVPLKAFDRIIMLVAMCLLFSFFAAEKQFEKMEGRKAACSGKIWWCIVITFVGLVINDMAAILFCAAVILASLAYGFRCIGQFMNGKEVYINENAI